MKEFKMQINVNKTVKQWSSKQKFKQQKFLLTIYQCGVGLLEINLHFSNE